MSDVNLSCFKGNSKHSKFYFKVRAIQIFEIFAGSFCYIEYQGWPHFLCKGQENGLNKLGGHKNVSKKGWPAKFETR